MSEFVRAYEGNEPYIFVSYAHKDSEKVLSVIRELYNKKYRIWYDEGIAPGSEWPQNIERHLRKASAVIAFVSGYSLNSPNCENEVIVAAGRKKETIQNDENEMMGAADGERETIQVSLDGVSKHPLLFNAKALDFDDSLINILTNSLGDELIGDGITGYQYSLDKKRSFNIWNLMLGLAAVLAITFSVALYGLYKGWFDDLLPAKQSVIETIAPTTQPQEAIAIDSNIIGSVLPVKFSSDEEKNAVYQKLGWTQPNEMTYKDLVEIDWLTHLEISDEPIYDISFTAYLPNLEVITLSSSQITDLTPLIECPKLKTVQVTADMLPVTLPMPRSFEVEVI